MSMTPEQMQAYTLQRELDERNRPLSEDDLDGMMPPGYKVSLTFCRRRAGRWRERASGKRGEMGRKRGKEGEREHSCAPSCASAISIYIGHTNVLS